CAPKCVNSRRIPSAVSITTRCTRPRDECSLRTRRMTMWVSSTGQACGWNARSLAAQKAAEFCARPGNGSSSSPPRAAQEWSLRIDPITCEVIWRSSVGPPPDGLAWDELHRQVLVADVETFDARLIDPHSGECRVIHE